jgi:hypothetical protein
VSGAIFALCLGALAFAQGVPLATRPAATLRWMRGLHPAIRFFLLRNDPNKMTVSDAQTAGYACFTFAALCIVVAILAFTRVVK